MLRVTKLAGDAGDPDIGERLHALSHAGKVEYVTLSRADMSRRRLRVVTDKGTDCAIVLPRSERLSNGAVLLLEDNRAVVVRMGEEKWLAIAASDAAAALELGYLAGNMHWRVRFDGDVLRIALEGAPAGYLARLAPLLDGGRARRTGE
ncbi:MAG: urease accessory protein UreE [Alphaproteobacteria bacterium]